MHSTYSIIQKKGVVKSMNVLFIGNSFAEDSTKYLQAISEEELVVRVLYIGACSLETHWKNFLSEDSCYVYEENAESIGRISLRAALADKKWDMISIQQYSRLSGILESYEPYMGNLIKGIKELCPNARLVFHRTWAYEDGCPELCHYDNSRKTMFLSIKHASDIIAKKYALDIIPCGDAVERARELSECVPGSEYCMTRDEHHLSLRYGRYLAALVCYAFFTGKSAQKTVFEPESTSSEMNKKLKLIADEILKNKEKSDV